MDVAEAFRHRFGARHRERRSSRRQDRRLGRGGRRGEHGDDQELVQRRSEHFRAQGGEHVFLVCHQAFDADVGLRRVRRR